MKNFYIANILENNIRYIKEAGFCNKIEKNNDLIFQKNQIKICFNLKSLSKSQKSLITLHSFSNFDRYFIPRIIGISKDMKQKL